jgi:Cd2+/Zn2+-exporting ATPase
MFQGLSASGQSSAVLTSPSSSADTARAPRSAAICTALCAMFGVLGWSLGDSPMRIAAFLAAYVVGSAVPTAGAVSALLQRQLGVDLLMTLAAIGAAVIGDWSEGVVLLFLFSLSGTLEAYAMYHTHRSIQKLVQLRPREAELVRGGEDHPVQIESLRIDDVVRVRPGQRFPVDGEIVEGETWADEATITGESTPVHKTVGSAVFAGTMNGRGAILVRMTRAVADSTLERIIQMVQQAQTKKTTTQKFIESWQQPYVLSVLLGAVLVLVGARLFHTADWDDAWYHAMVLMVAASPCAVVLSSPAAVLSAIARAARRGVLFKGGIYLEMLGRVDTIAFDKTGTITRGRPSVVELTTNDGMPADRILQLAASVEHDSEHHLAEAVLAEAAKYGLEILPVEEFENHPGLGVHAHVQGRWVGVGREGLFNAHNVELPEDLREMAKESRSAGRTALIVVVPGEGGGVIGLADEVRPEAASAVASLKRLGIREILVLTGDHQKTADDAAVKIGADEVRAGLLPEQKVSELVRLMESDRTLAMVGDGINDAPALAAAHVGIAMGGAGTDVALEAADVVLMRDDLKSLPFAVWLSRRARRRVRQNMTFAFAMIGILVASGFLGLPLWMGVLGHEGSTLMVVLNGLRLLWDKPPAL